MTFNFAGSNVLARQIVNGAPVDVFVSADESADGRRRPRRADRGGHAGRRSPGTRWCSWPTRGRSIRTLADLGNDDVRRIAIGDPAAVPAGVYARQYLERHRPVGTARAEDRADDQRSRGVDGGAERQRRGGLRLRHRRAGWRPRSRSSRPSPAPARRASCIRRASVRTTRQPAAAAAFLKFLRSPAAAAILARHGFVAARRPLIAAADESVADHVVHADRGARRDAADVAVRAAARLGPGAPAVPRPRAARHARVAAAGDAAGRDRVAAADAVRAARSDRRGARARIGIEVVFTWKAVVLAMAIMALPLFVRTARAGFEQVERRYESVAATLGAPPWRVFLTVSLPLAAPSLIAATVLGFARSIGEFGATIVIAGSIPGSTRTLAVAIYSFAETGNDREAAVLLAVSAAIAFAAPLDLDGARPRQRRRADDCSRLHPAAGPVHARHRRRPAARRHRAVRAVGSGQDDGARRRRRPAPAARRARSSSATAFCSRRSPHRSCRHTSATSVTSLRTWPSSRT